MKVLKLKKGWALKTKRAVKRFSSNQTSFLKDIFLQGEITGHKSDSEEVATKMWSGKKNGRRQFAQQECLTATQIASYFSHMALEKKGKVHRMYLKMKICMRKNLKTI